MLWDSLRKSLNMDCPPNMDQTSMVNGISIIKIKNAYKFKTIGLHGRPDFLIDLIEFEHQGSHATKTLRCAYLVCIPTCLRDFSWKEKNHHLIMAGIHYYLKVIRLNLEKLLVL